MRSGVYWECSETHPATCPSDKSWVLHSLWLSSGWAPLISTRGSFHWRGVAELTFTRGGYFESVAVATWFTSKPRGRQSREAWGVFSGQTSFLSKMGIIAPSFWTWLVNITSIRYGWSLRQSLQYDFSARNRMAESIRNLTIQTVIPSETRVTLWNWALWTTLGKVSFKVLRHDMFTTFPQFYQQLPTELPPVLEVLWILISHKPLISLAIFMTPDVNFWKKFFWNCELFNVFITFLLP